MIFARLGSEKLICAELLRIYRSRVEQPSVLAVEGRIVLLQDEIGTGIDISLGGLHTSRGFLNEVRFRSCRNMAMSERVAQKT